MKVKTVAQGLLAQKFIDVSCKPKHRTLFTAMHAILFGYQYSCCLDDVHIYRPGSLDFQETRPMDLLLDGSSRQGQNLETKHNGGTLCRYCHQRTFRHSAVLDLGVVQALLPASWCRVTV